MMKKKNEQANSRKKYKCEITSAFDASVGVKPVIQPIRAKNIYKSSHFKKKVPFTLLYCDKY
jgi:hypothetical protein